MITKDSHQEIECWKCHTSYVLPRSLYVAAKASEKIGFFCPYGHAAHFPESETVEDKLRRERDRLTQRLAEKDDQITTQGREIAKLQKVERELKSEKRKITKRVSHGVCPCCNRQFQNMRDHMRMKHPEFKAEAA